MGTGSTIDGLYIITDRSSNTGYYLKKFLGFNVNFSKASPGTAFHLFPLIRLGDMLLLYAEAMNEAYGPDTDPNGYGLTAKGAVQRVRTRAGFNAASDKYLINATDVAAMRTKIKNERRVELAFEEQRYLICAGGWKAVVKPAGYRYTDRTGGCKPDRKLFYCGWSPPFETKMIYTPYP